MGTLLSILTKYKHHIHSCSIAYVIMTGGGKANTPWQQARNILGLERTMVEQILERLRTCETGSAHTPFHLDRFRNAPDMVNLSKVESCFLELFSEYFWSTAGWIHRFQIWKYRLQAISLEGISFKQYF